MPDYRYFKVKIEILSPIGTPLLGDTIWGHICWGIRYYKSESALKEFLQKYNSENPPLIISDGFFENTLPVPLLTPYISENLNIKRLNDLKKRKKIKYIPADLIFKERNISIFKLQEIPVKKFENVRLRNTIDRLRGTTKEEGGLFEDHEIWYERGAKFDIYVLSTLKKEKVYELFCNAFSLGYGKDITTGKGIIEVVEVNEIQVPQSCNRVMALSSFVPSQRDKIKNMYADIFTKYEKIGGEYAVNKNPFKKPLVMFKTGATFELEEKKFYVGSLISNIHKDKNIKHYAYAPLLYFNEEGYNG